MEYNDTDNHYHDGGELKYNIIIMHNSSFGFALPWPSKSKAYCKWPKQTYGTASSSHFYT